MKNHDRNQAQIFPYLWSNWISDNDGLQQLGMYEFELFTDAWIIGEESFSPYCFQNTVPVSNSHRFDLTPSIVVRVRNFIDHTIISDMSKTSDSHYHGGGLNDEIAALVSLVLGIRVEAGPISREFNPGDDPLGKPHRASDKPQPTLGSYRRNIVIPWLRKDAYLSELGILKGVPQLKQRHAIALVKSARLFQSALWMSDASPEISWLMLVSALETAANCWDAASSSPVEKLKMGLPKVHEILSREDVPSDTLEMVALELEKLIRSTDKFRRFCMEFKPVPPLERPPYDQFSFQREDYQRSISKIYNYRSKALHEGKPFPYPMCMIPHSAGSNIYDECPGGLSVAGRGGVWVQRDLPLHLHLFAYITQQTLLGWFRSLV